MTDTKLRLSRLALHLRRYLHSTLGMAHERSELGYVVFTQSDGLKIEVSDLAVMTIHCPGGGSFEVDAVTNPDWPETLDSHLASPSRSG